MSASNKEKQKIASNPNAVINPAVARLRIHQKPQGRLPISPLSAGPPPIANNQTPPTARTD